MMNPLLIYLAELFEDGTRPFLSTKCITRLISNMRHLLPSTGVEVLLRAMARHVQNCDQFDANDLFLSLKGIHNFHESKTVQKLLDAISPKVNNINSMQLSHIVKGLDSLKKFPSNGTVDNLRFAMLSYTTDEHVFNGYDLRAIVCGLKKINSPDAMEQALTLLKRPICECRDMNSALFANIFYLLRNVKLSPVVKEILDVLLPQLDSIITKYAKIHFWEIVNIVGGFKNLSSIEAAPPSLRKLLPYIQRGQCDTRYEVLILAEGLCNFPDDEVTELALCSLANHIKLVASIGPKDATRVMYALRNRPASQGRINVIDSLLSSLESSKRLHALDVQFALEGMRSVPGNNAVVRPVLIIMNQHIRPVEPALLAEIIFSLKDYLQAGLPEAVDLVKRAAIESLSQRQLQTVEGQEQIIMELLAGKASDEIDLHYLSHHLAGFYVEAALRQWSEQTSRNGKLTIIFGRGNHSKGSRNPMREVVKNAMENDILYQAGCVTARWDDSSVELIHRVNSREK